MAQAGAVAVVEVSGSICNGGDMARKLSRKAQRLIDSFAGDVSDHREWNNEYNLKRSRAALVAYIARLEEEKRNARSSRR